MEKKEGESFKIVEKRTKRTDKRDPRMERRRSSSRHKRNGEREYFVDSYFPVLVT